METKNVPLGHTIKVRGALISPASIDFEAMLKEEEITREEVIEAFAEIRYETLELFNAEKIPLKEELKAKRAFLSLWDSKKVEYFYQLSEEDQKELKSTFENWVDSCSNKARLDKVFDFYNEMYGHLNDGVCFLKYIILSKTLEEAQEEYVSKSYPGSDREERRLSIIVLSSFYRKKGRHPKMKPFVPPVKHNDVLNFGGLFGIPNLPGIF